MITRECVGGPRDGQKVVMPDEARVIETFRSDRFARPMSAQMASEFPPIVRGRYVVNRAGDLEWAGWEDAQ